MNNIKNIKYPLISLIFLVPYYALAVDTVLDRISSVFDYVSYVSSNKAVTDSEVIKIACEAFGVSPTDAYEKMAYAYFADGYDAKNEQEKEVLAQLGNLEYFPGSVTSKLLVNELTDFIKITTNKPVRVNQKTSIEILEEFIAGVARGQWQGEAIDALRARNPQLALLAKTGSALSITASECSKDVDELTQKTLISLKQMQPGEIQMFLAGNLIHDTRLIIKKVDYTQWSFLSYDSARFPSSVSQYNVKSPNDEYINAFFKNFYSTKFTIVSPKEVFEFLGNPEEIAEASLVSSLQSKSTCHFRGLWAALKDFFIRHHKHSLDVALMEWATFELQFGEFILSQNKIENKSLSIIAVNRLEELKRRVAVLEQFGNYLNNSSIFNTQVDEYTKILSTIKLRSIPDTLQGLLARLIFAHDAIIDSPAASELTAKTWKNLLQNQTLDLLEVTWQEIEIRQEVANRFFAGSIEKEFERAESEFYCFCDGLKRPLFDTLFTNGLDRVIVFLDLPPKFQPSTALNLKDIHSYLNRIKNNTHILSLFECYPCVRRVLEQAIQNKLFGEIEELLQSLPQEIQSNILVRLQSVKPAVKLPDFYFAAESYMHQKPNSLLKLMLPQISAKKIVAAIGDDANRTSALINELFPEAAFKRNTDNLVEVAFMSDGYDVVHISNTNNNREETREKAVDLLCNDDTRLVIIYVDAAKNTDALSELTPTDALLNSVIYAIGVDEKAIIVVNYPEYIDEHQISKDRAVLRNVFDRDIDLYPITSHNLSLVKSSIMSKIEENMKKLPE